MISSKKSTALLSFAFSILLAIVKLFVGIISGSLSILAEAADSLIDLVTDAVTFIAVRVADVPPDDDHPYGHARAEHLGALAQAMLMGVTYGWFLWQACDHIVFHPEMPAISPWVFLVVTVSVLINVVRVYRLNQAASQFKSQALAASAANFTNDILRSMVVLLAMMLIVLHTRLPFPFWLIERFDAIATAIVSLIALRVAWRVGERAIHALMDSIPDELSHKLTRRIAELPSVIPESAHVRARFVGEQPLVDVMVGMPRGHSLEEAHELAHSVEDAVRKELKNAQVLVHIEPTRTTTEPFTTTVYSTAQRLGLRVHHLEIYQLKDSVRVEMDLELPGSLTLREAHTYSERLEAAIAAELPCKTIVAVHLEPRYDQVVPAVHHGDITQEVNEVLQSLPYAPSIMSSETLLTDDGIIVTLRCRFSSHTLLTEVHATMARMERDLRRAMPEIVRVQIDPEPVNDDRG